MSNSSSVDSHFSSTTSRRDSNASETSSLVSTDFPLSGAVSDPSVDLQSDAGSNIPSSVDELTQEDKDEALRLKTEANKAFTASNHRLALDMYTASINRNPFESTVWCNRAACRLKFEEHGLAISDATKAISLNEKYTKAYFRRAQAYLAILKPKNALVDFKKVVALEPGNAAGKTQVDAVTKLVRRMEFEKAIASKEQVSVSHRIIEQLESGVDVESSYLGPRLEYVESSSNADTESTNSSDQKTIRKKKPVITQKFVDDMIQYFKDGKCIHRRYAWEIVLGAQAELQKHSSLAETTVNPGEKCDVVGDTHGQFFDLLHLLNLSGFPSSSHTMVFNGDFVDRGSWSTEVVLTLFALKWLYPESVFLNRGNHETSDMNKVYGFEGETKKKYSELTYKLFEEVFNDLTLGTLVKTSVEPSVKDSNITLDENNRKRYLVLHGGLFSKDDVTLDDIRKVNRKRQPGSEGIMCEMLWTDPQDEPGRGPSKRGVGISFGPDVTKRWTEANQITSIIRSHEVRLEGYTVEHDGRCITVFSAPNYVDQAGNKAAFITINDQGTLDFTQFEAQPHPNIRPMAYAGGFGLGGVL